MFHLQILIGFLHHLFNT